MSIRHVLALNSGSSTLKFGLYRVDAECAELLLSQTLSATDADSARGMHRVQCVLKEAGLPAPDAIGHRIVHGGPQLSQPCLLNAAVLRQLESATAFAPLHMPAALALIAEAQTGFPALPQAACFDTHFHADLPEIARILPIPRELQSSGVRRYGFHGLSCESIIHQLGEDRPRRVVIAHLGNGASITAVKDGRSVDTSMGLTPSGGLIMGTRSGDLDPGLLIHLMRQHQLDVAMLEELLNKRSGLLGVSGLSSDMRRLQEAAPSNANAALAIRMFCISVRKQIAAMIAVLDGLDLLVFTGGIGENHADVRADICAGLSWIGVRLDEGRNRAASNPISGSGSRTRVQVIASREDQRIARHTWSLLQA